MSPSNKTNVESQSGQRIVLPATDVEHTTVETEAQFHHYRGNDIPWYVRVMWLGFWVLAVAYTIQLLFPALQVELFKKP